MGDLTLLNSVALHNFITLFTHDLSPKFLIVTATQKKLTFTSLSKLAVVNRKWKELLSQSTSDQLWQQSTLPKMIWRNRICAFWPEEGPQRILFIMKNCSGNYTDINDSFRYELMHRFSFPERPGSLKGFLEKLQMMAVSTQGSRWNLTLVHYRSTGGDVARILIGIDVPHEAEENGDLGKFLASCGCNFVEETNNPVYQHFLR
jgi:hypothetical protein